MSLSPLPGLEQAPVSERSEAPTAPSRRPSESSPQSGSRSEHRYEDAPADRDDFRARLADRSAERRPQRLDHPDGDVGGEPSPTDGHPAPVPTPTADAPPLAGSLIPAAIVPMLTSFASNVEGAQGLDLDGLDAATPLLPPIVGVGDGDDGDDESAGAGAIPLTAGAVDLLASMLGSDPETDEGNGGDLRAILAQLGLPVADGAQPTTTGVGQPATASDGEAALPQLRPALDTTGNAPSPTTTIAAATGPEISVAAPVAPMPRGDERPTDNQSQGLAPNAGQGANAGSSDVDALQAVTAASESDPENGDFRFASHQRGAAELGRGEMARVEPSAMAQRAAEANAADRAVTGQISRALVQQMADGQRVLTLRLTPPELGTVRIQVIEQGGQLSVRFSAEDDGVRAAIERALPQMRQDLRHGEAPIADLQLVDDHPGFEQQDADRGSDGGDGDGPNDEEESAFSIEGFTPRRRSPRPHLDLGARVTETGVDARA